MMIIMATLMIIWNCRTVFMQVQDKIIMKMEWNSFRFNRIWEQNNLKISPKSPIINISMIMTGRNFRISL